MSEYMLLMAEIFIDGLATLLIRVAAARFSAFFMQMVTYVNFRGKGWKNNDGKNVTVMEQFQAMQSPWILGQNPGLALFVIFSAVLTNNTAVPFAMS